jgi:hypothetical protein
MTNYLCDTILTDYPMPSAICCIPTILALSTEKRSM